MGVVDKSFSPEESEMLEIDANVKNQESRQLGTIIGKPLP